MTGRILSSRRWELQITTRNNIGRYLFVIASAAAVFFLWGLGQ